MSNTPLELVINRLPDVKQNGNQWSARCPAHDDRKPSLSITRGEDGRVLLHCHAGCPPEAICQALGIGLRDLMPPDNGKPAPRRLVSSYDYHDENGELLFQVCRFEPKEFWQRRPDGKGCWIWSVKGVRQVPFNLPAIVTNEGQIVCVVEGEKDVLALARIGVLATCNAGGAGKWRKSHAQHLKARKVVVLPDNDEPGRKHARQVALSLRGVAESVRIVELPRLPEKGDVSDWIASGGTKSALLDIINEAPEWMPEHVQSEPWPEFEPLDNRDLPTFPVEALPAPLRNWVEAESEATQTPPALSALLSLAVCSATIAGRVEVVPRRGWREPTNLFVAVLLEPGNRKSSVFSDCVRPLREMESERLEAARPTVARFQSERRQDEARLKKLEKLAAEDGDREAAEQACELAAELAIQPRATMPRLIVDDATTEKVGAMLAEQDGRLASMSAEGGVFDLMAGLYSKSKAPNFDVYLKAHAGDSLVTDRVGRQDVHVERPALTCGYAIQPAVIQGLAKNPAFRGRGLLGRFLYAFPKSPIGERRIAPPVVPEATYAAYVNTVRRMAGADVCSELKFTDEACRRLIAWETEVEAMLRDGGELEAIRDWGGKLAGATLRLAAVMHCADGNSGPIGSDSLDRAVQIARYLIPHADSVLRLMNCAELSADADAAYLAQWIERERLEQFTKREAHRHGLRRFDTAEDLDPALNILERRGYIREIPQPTEGPGRKPSPLYEVRPEVLNSDSLETVDKVDTIQPEAPREGNSVNCVNAFQETEDQNDWGEI